MSGACWPRPGGLLGSNGGGPDSPGTGTRIHWPLRFGYFASSKPCAFANPRSQRKHQRRRTDQASAQHVSSQLVPLAGCGAGRAARPGIIVVVPDSAGDGESYTTSRPAGKGREGAPREPATAIRSPHWRAAGSRWAPRRRAFRGLEVEDELEGGGLQKVLRSKRSGIQPSPATSGDRAMGGTISRRLQRLCEFDHIHAAPEAECSRPVRAVDFIPVYGLYSHHLVPHRGRASKAFKVRGRSERRAGDAALSFRDRRGDIRGDWGGGLGAGSQPVQAAQAVRS